MGLKSRVSLKELERRAYHEAGHAVVAFRLGFLPKKIRIATTVGGIHRVNKELRRKVRHYGWVEFWDGFSDEDIGKLIVITYAGIGADVRFFGHDRSCVECTDTSKAADLLNSIGQYENLEEWYFRAYRYVIHKKNWKAIRAVAAELVKKRELSYPEFEKAMILADGVFNHKRLHRRLEEELW